MAGFHIEDTDFSGGKHFVAPEGSGAGALDLGRDTLRPAEQFVECVRAAVETRGDADTVIIARTDAAVRSVDQAIDRAGRSVEAGADMVFLCWLPPEEVARVVAAVDVPLLYLSHNPSPADLHALERDGANLVFRPSFTWTVAFRAMHDALHELKTTGEVADFETRKARNDERYAAVSATEWTEFARRRGM